MEPLETFSKSRLMLSFEECIANLRMQAARLGTTMGTSAGAQDLHEFNSLQERYVALKTEILRRMP